MLEIAGGILLAVAVLAVVAVTFRHIVLALSAIVCLAVTGGAWLLIASYMGRWSATATIVVGLAIWFWNANRDPGAQKSPDSDSAGPRPKGSER